MANTWCARISYAKHSPDSMKGNVVIEDLKIIDPVERRIKALALSSGLYSQRRNMVAAKSDGREFFGDKGMHLSYSSGELAALAIYAQAGVLDTERIMSGPPVTAYESLRSLGGLSLLLNRIEPADISAEEERRFLGDVGVRLLPPEMDNLLLTVDLATPAR